MFMFLFLFFSVLLLRSFFRLKELFQVKNGLTTSLLVFFLKMLKIWVGQTTLKEEKKEDGLTLTKEEVSEAGQVRVDYDAGVLTGSYRY